MKFSWKGIAFHFCWNFFQSLFGFNVSGKNFYGMYELQIQEPSVLNGGHFGFEGTIWSIISEVLVIVFTIWYLKKNPKKVGEAGIERPN